ncbi:MAG: DUF4118 domain-containing protein [Hyphomonadaceae bacterium]
MVTRANIGEFGAALVAPIRRALDARAPLPRWIIGLTSGVLLSAMSAITGTLLERYLGVHSPSMVFLCSVIAAAFLFGRAIAIATAFIAFFAYNFYLADPRFSFELAEPDEILTLIVFVGVAIFIGGLTGRVQDERRRAEAQARMFAALFGASRAMAKGGERTDTLETLARGAAELSGGDVLLFTKDEQGRLKPVSAASRPALEIIAAAEDLSAKGDGQAGAVIDMEDLDGVEWRLIRLDDAKSFIAVLAWTANRTSRGEDADLAVRLLADLAMISLERVRLSRQRIEIDTLAAAEQLRTALMSSISHDFRTPLSTILASASSMLEFGDRFSGATRRDLLISIQEEAERLNRFVGNILDMTRLEAGAVRLREEWVDPVEILESIKERMQKRLGARSLRLVIPAAAPAIRGDSILLEQAIVNAIENALVHTPENTEIVAGAAFEADHVRIWVEDDGAGVPEDDLARIFDKFHRVAQPEKASGGAGLGLSISKGFVEAMKGRAAAISPAAGGRGLRVEFVFPRERERTFA